ncbi:MAG: Mov34/MPN/PAD-1 family protein [Chloroflexota bacterium]|nr:Mov34/MPN/PAD-1 family protein [Chloroflexota bacterium]
MKGIVGYQVNHRDGVLGESGQAYDYIMAGNGLFVRAEKLAPGGLALLRATVQVAEAPVRELAPLAPAVEFPQGKPLELHWHAFLALAKQRPSVEVYAAVVWRDGAYHLAVPEQEGTGAHVEYQAVADTVVDMHSHGHMGAWFSTTDDADDTGFKVSVVLGRLDMLTYEVEARVSVYGYHDRVYVGDIFR